MDSPRSGGKVAGRVELRLSPIAGTVACAVMDPTPGMVLKPPHRHVGLDHR
jgi:hypothetical protein